MLDLFSNCSYAIHIQLKILVISCFSLTVVLVIVALLISNKVIPHKALNTCKILAEGPSTVQLKNCKVCYSTQVQVELNSDLVYTGAANAMTTN